MNASPTPPIAARSTIFHVIDDQWRFDGHREGLITVPVLVMHGDDDQIVPLCRFRAVVGQIAAEEHIETYKGFPYGYAND